MKIRMFSPADSEAIISWISSEEEMFKWATDRLGMFPAAPDTLARYYAQYDDGSHIPITAYNEYDEVEGHILIRFPDKDDDKTVRFGFVIVDPMLRGQGMGKEMLRLAIDYARFVLNVNKITIGVFENNPSALNCYKNSGFKEVSRSEMDSPIGKLTLVEMEQVFGTV